MSISNSSKPLFVYLQRPDNGDWVVVGRYKLDPVSNIGMFRYADSYLDAGHKWSIDPVSLPLRKGEFLQAARYAGLHDILRDASPDAWGQALLRRAHNLPEGCTPLRYLALSGNGDRWGALAIGNSPAPSLAKLASPRLEQLSALIAELTAISENRPALNASLRKRLFATPSMGGARPKATVSDADSYWLVKPGLATDTVDLALLEHVTQQWGRAAGLHFAQSVHHPIMSGRSAVRILRFDRHGSRRLMTISAASLLQVAYPPMHEADYTGASYARLAEELRRIGVPAEDWKCLFGRMVFNAVVGNDDDHPRNHAVVYAHEERRWRLAPAFDVVPNPEENPARLFMQVSTGRREISRANLLADFQRFGFASHQDAAAHLDELLEKISASFIEIAPLFSDDLKRLMQQRLLANTALLK